MGRRLQCSNMHVSPKTILSYVGLHTPHGNTPPTIQRDPSRTFSTSAKFKFVCQSAQCMKFHHICGCSSWPLQQKLQTFRLTHKVWLWLKSGFDLNLLAWIIGETSEPWNKQFGLWYWLYHVVKASHNPSLPYFVLRQISTPLRM